MIRPVQLIAKLLVSEALSVLRCPLREAACKQLQCDRPRSILEEVNGGHEAPNRMILLLTPVSCFPAELYTVTQRANSPVRALLQLALFVPVTVVCREASALTGPLC